MKNQSHIILWTALLAISYLTCHIKALCFPKNDDSSLQPTDQQISRYANDTVDFTLSLFKKISQHKTGLKDNVFASPLSVHFALTIVSLGSKGNTKTELDKALFLTNINQKDLIETSNKLKDKLLHNVTNRENYTVNIADKLYLDDKVQLSPSLLNDLKDDTEKLNLAGASEASRQVINQWVESQTNNKIVNLIPEGFIKADTRIVVVNAVYFKAYWQNQFNEKATKQEDFIVDANTKVKVAMMHHNEESLFYAHDSELRSMAVKLPYSGQKMSMIILLPDVNVKVDDVISSMSRERLRVLSSRMSSNTVNLALPKFEIRQSMELTSDMQSLGVKDLFDPARADLSGLTGQRNLFVSFIQHQSFVAVNEGGTEAAAATAVGVSLTSIALNPINIIINRPFVFFIRDEELNTILFIGTIRDPTSSR